MQRYGLIGRTLGHSFSKTYFTEKFSSENINASFENFEVPAAGELGAVLHQPDLAGLSVTIPYKTAIISCLDHLDDVAKEVGAVNCVQFENGVTIGHNTDVTGFSQSVRNFYKGPASGRALVLGTGGSSKAVCYALRQMLGFSVVHTASRTTGKGDFTYAGMSGEKLADYHLIVNTTPLGMSPDVSSFPEISYQALGPSNHLFDLVYNPAETVFLQKGKMQGCPVRNGLEMLHLQAEAAWQWWTGKR